MLYVQCYLVNDWMDNALHLCAYNVIKNMFEMSHIVNVTHTI